MFNDYYGKYYIRVFLSRIGDFIETECGYLKMKESNVRFKE